MATVPSSTDEISPVGWVAISVISTLIANALWEGYKGRKDRKNKGA